jgi:hypothetical protein
VTRDANILIKLLKFDKQHIAETSTLALSAAMDEEAPADRKTLESLIADRVTKETRKLPPNVRALLGLGLTFCPTKRTTNDHRTIDFERLNRDLQIKLFFAGTQQR